MLGQALDTHNGCARASMLLGDMEHDAGHHAAALLAYSRVDGQDTELLPEVLESMYACQRELGHTDRMIEYLRECIPRDNGNAPVILLTDILVEQHRQEEACELITRQLARSPSLRSLAKYLDLRLAGCRTNEQETLVVLKKFAERLQKGRPAYLCGECGFAGKTLHWQCPGCKCWDTVRPLHDAEPV